MSECPSCSREYKSVMRHMARSECEAPDLSREQEDIITGLMMGDGSFSRSAAQTPRIEVSSVSTKFLEFLNRKFPFYSNGYRLQETAEESAEHMSEWKEVEANPDNYSDKYHWYTKYSDVFEKWDWGRGGKRFPDDIKPTPTSLKYWYAGDGHYDKKGYIVISSATEAQDERKIEKLFEEAEVEPSSISNNSYKNGNIIFPKDESLKLWEIMGEPVPGFEYKWPENMGGEGPVASPSQKMVRRGDGTIKYEEVENTAGD